MEQQRELLERANARLSILFACVLLPPPPPTLSMCMRSRCSVLCVCPLHRSSIELGCRKLANNHRASELPFNSILATSQIPLARMHPQHPPASWLLSNISPPHRISLRSIHEASRLCIRRAKQPASLLQPLTGCSVAFLLSPTIGRSNDAHTRPESRRTRPARLRLMAPRLRLIVPTSALSLSFPLRSTSFYLFQSENCRPSGRPAFSPPLASDKEPASEHDGQPQQQLLKSRNQLNPTDGYHHCQPD